MAEKKSHFSEAEYECNLMNELRTKYSIHNSNPGFKPSIQAEKYLGIDLAILSNYLKKYSSKNVELLDPRFVWNTKIRVWKQVNIQHKGLKLEKRYKIFKDKIKDLFTKTPKRYVSMFLQCKVPVSYLEPFRSVKGSRASGKSKPFDIWNTWNTPKKVYKFIYAFSLSQGQNETLYELMKSFGDDAFVGYVAPTYHTYIQADKYYRNKQIANNSHFQHPFNPKNKHYHYSYLPGKPLAAGQAFSVAKDYPAIDFEIELIRKAIRREINNQLGEREESYSNNKKRNEQRRTIEDHIDVIYKVLCKKLSKRTIDNVDSSTNVKEYEKKYVGVNKLDKNYAKEHLSVLYKEDQNELYEHLCKYYSIKRMVRSILRCNWLIFNF
ncbi:hypothetical protein ACRPLQ_09010 [Priestia sp. TRN 1309]|uniref:hypothetical protein n=1 Tax=Priestia sp. TRN 1309 TaxID=3420729 RepID=UPI003D77906A